MGSRATEERPAGRSVLMVGLRRGALYAAERLGLETWVLAPRQVSKGQRRRLAGSLVQALDVESLLPSAETLLGGRVPDAVVALTEESVVPAATLREQLGVPGVSVATAEACHDKVRMKARASAGGIPCVLPEVVQGTESAEELCARLGLPLVLKERALSGARGTVIGRDLESVASGIAPGKLAEPFIQGIEMSLESLVVEGRILFTNPTEYLEPLWANVVPAVLADDVWTALCSFNAQVIECFGVDRGLVHVEVFRTATGIVLGELAVRPPGGYLMELISIAYGFPAWEAFLRAELGEAPAISPAVSCTTGVWLLHPGPGTLRSVTGLDEARAVPGITEVRCKLSPGDHVGPRHGSGQDIGRIVATASTRDEVATALRRARELIRLEVTQRR